MKRRPRSYLRKSTRAFTLLELLLVVVLVIMLTGAMVFNFSSLLSSNELEEGTTRIETLMRYARAQAANSGRRVQLVFNSESTNTAAAATGEVRAVYEPDPLGQPGYFADLVEAQWHVQEINDLVQVESVTLLDTSTACPIESSNAGEEFEDEPEFATKPLSPITFYPDGSSDSAEIIVAPKSPEEVQRMAVRLVGLTGNISHYLVSLELDDPLGDSVLSERSSTRRDSIPRDTAIENDAAPSASSARSASSSSRPPTTPRAPVGGTNTIGRIE